MRTTRSLSAATAAVLCLTLVAACGSSDDGAEAGDATAADSSGDPTGGAETPVPEIDFSGLVMLRQEGGPPALRIVDPAETERLVDETPAVVQLPDSTSGSWSRSSFSEDWQYAVHGGSGTIIFSRFDPDTASYVDLFTIEPGEDSYSSEADVYENAVFAPTGTTVWLEKTTADGVVLSSIELSEDSSAEDVVDSDLTIGHVSDGSNEPAWVFDSAGEPMPSPEDNDERVTIGAESDFDAEPGDWRAHYLVDPAGAVVDPWVYSFGDGSSPTTYEVVRRLGPTEFVMVAKADNNNSNTGAKPNGVVARVTIDPSAKNVTFEPIVPLGADEQLAWWARMSPDGDAALVCVPPDEADASSTGTAYYFGEIGAEPEERGDCYNSEEEILDWS